MINLGGPITIIRGSGGGYKLLVTGQTTQYGGYPDDGFYQAGHPKAYTVLTTGQYSGTTNVTINAKTDVKSNNCVFDRNTKLMWSRYVSATVGPTNNGLIPWTTNVNGEGIFTYCAAANAASLAGYSDWRVANEVELLNLRNVEVATAAPDAVAFPTWPTSAGIVSSTTIASNTARIHEVIFLSGNLGEHTKSGGGRWVALVRGGI